ncbi:RNA polymerase sigma factor SigJ [uncultured Tateyamaria sp.]|uniref:RNA polymerase sigma factor SigJ n=1 Tax=Tateyamaria sp. 1078 TaxID=3417464 RepID=UPI002634F0FA|nr:RNA polymerase sigma factor SigJ [uncultured Tateyamaria sp.]
MSQNTDTPDAALFDSLRPRLTGLAYRILGSLSDAEDVVQDTFVKWARADRPSIDNPTGWLVTACTRRCLDVRRTGDRARVDYVGAWLPEPIQISTDMDAEARLTLSSSLSMAFLTMLERLTPKERAAFLLHDIFDLPHADVARTLDVTEASSRKLVSRARGHVGRSVVRHDVPVDRQMAFLSAFQNAVQAGDVGSLSSMLAADARLRADGGGKVPAVLEPVVGRAALCAFLANDLGTYWGGHDWTVADLNGARGIFIGVDGRITAAVSFAYDQDHRVDDIFIVRNPDKLTRRDAVYIH